MNGNSNAALRTYASSSDHVTHNVYNSIILYTLEADANWDYISLANSNVVSDMDTSITSAVLNIYTLFS